MDKSGAKDMGGSRWQGSRGSSRQRARVAVVGGGSSNGYGAEVARGGRVIIVARHRHCPGQNCHHHRPFSSLRLAPDAPACAKVGGVRWLPCRPHRRRTRPFASRPTPRHVRGGRGRWLPSYITIRLPSDHCHVVSPTLPSSDYRHHAHHHNHNQNRNDYHFYIHHRNHPSL